MSERQGFGVSRHARDISPDLGCSPTLHPVTGNAYASLCAYAGFVSHRPYYLVTEADSSIMLRPSPPPPHALLPPPLSQVVGVLAEDIEPPKSTFR